MSFSVGSGGSDPVGGGVPGSSAFDDPLPGSFEGFEDIGSHDLSKVSEKRQPTPTPPGGTSRGLDMPTSLHQQEVEHTIYGPVVIGQDVAPSVHPPLSIPPSTRPAAFAAQNPLSAATLSELGFGTAGGGIPAFFGKEADRVAEALVADLLPISADVDPAELFGPQTLGSNLPATEVGPLTQGPEFRRYCRGLWRDFGELSVFIDPRCIPYL